MFPFQRSCELSFKISDEGDDKFEQASSFEDQIMLDNNHISSGAFGSAGLGPNNAAISTARGRGRGQGQGQGRGRGHGRGHRSSSSSSLAGTVNVNNYPNNNSNNEDERKIMHREYERQRRQEMANLYNSLRSTLPAEYTQGKRSVSDHLGEAINYITQLKQNVKELEEKRDQIKESTTTSSSSTHELGGSSSNNDAGSAAGAGRCNNVMIRESVVGFVIEISVANEDRFSLSTALQVVFDQGLEVVSCTSTNFDDRLIHNLQCQVGDTTCIDVNQLQQRLSDVVC